MEPVYPALLGSAWSELGVPVKNLHGAHSSARGLFQVIRGEGLLARFIGACCGMPPAGEHVPVTLDVKRSNETEEWSRSFAGRPLLTKQWMSKGLLVEALGLVLCLFRLKVEEGVLIFEQVGASFGGRFFALPIPSFLAPRIEGRATHDGDRVHVHVRISAPLVGLLVSYEGRVATEGPAPEAQPAP